MMIMMMHIIIVGWGYPGTMNKLIKR